jgi:RNA polymerase sigma-70 factor (ECF subfamily)
MTATPPRDESALIEASQAGDPRALDELVRRNQDRVYSFAMRMCRNVEDAKDILQETFLGVVRSIRDFRAESRFSTWLYRIAANACLKKRRRGVFDPEPEQEISLDALMPRPDAEGRKPEIPDWSEDAERALLRGELVQQMEAAIDKLPREYKIVIILRDVEGFSAEETADLLKLSVPAVKSRLHRARVFVRKELSRYFEAEQRLGSPGGEPA